MLILLFFFLSFLLHIVARSVCLIANTIVAIVKRLEDIVLFVYVLFSVCWPPIGPQDTKT